jgi:CheY-like chemotaxis protein
MTPQLGFAENPMAVNDTQAAQTIPLGLPIVLYADNDPLGRYLVARTFRVAGFHVLEASAGSEVLALATRRPDLIVLATNLPDVPAVEVCRRLRQDPVTAKIPLLGLSVAFPTVEKPAAELAGLADAQVSSYAGPTTLVARAKGLLAGQESR